MNSVRTIKLFQPTELNLVNSNNVGTENSAANIDNNNDIFEAIGHALIDTFNAGNKNTIGLTQAFVSRFEQLIKSGKKIDLLNNPIKQQFHKEENKWNF